MHEAWINLPWPLQAALLVVGFFLLLLACVMAVLGAINLLAALIHRIGPDREVDRYIFGRTAQKNWVWGHGG
jgi:hypothetical protein